MNPSIPIDLFLRSLNHTIELSDDLSAPDFQSLGTDGMGRAARKLERIKDFAESILEDI